MKLGATRRMEAIIPTASMADIAFLLIIFFMVTTVHDVDRTNVALPQSVERQETQKGAAYVIVHKDRETGIIQYKFSDGKEKSRDVGSPENLYLEASRIAARDSLKQFVIKGDSGIRYALIDEVLDKLREGGVQEVLLLTQQKAGGPEQ